MAKKVGELPVYQKARAFGIAVSAILRRPALRKDLKHRGQLSNAIDSIRANIEEGFEQGTDKAFAHYLRISKGSTGEAAGHLTRACEKGYISQKELDGLLPEAEQIGKMLGGFIKYLERCDYKDRGHYLATHPPDQPAPDGPPPAPNSDPDQEPPAADPE